MSTQQPEALRLAELLTADEWPGHMTLVSYARECVAELRRLHALNAEMLEALKDLDEAYSRAGPGLSRAERAVDRLRVIAARAAIAKAEGREA